MANEVKLKLAIEGGQVVGATLDGVSSKLDGVDRSARGASGGVGELKGILAGIATIGTAMELIQMADACTSLRTSLKLSSNGAQEAGVAYERLFGIAQQARVEFTALGGTYSTIARAGKELGVSQDRLLAVTQAIGMAMTIGGGSAQSMNAALVQLGQGISSGTLRGEELNSILEQTPRLAKALADGMGVSVGQLRSLGEQGKLTAEAVIGALEKSAPQLAKEMGDATVTVGQAFTMLTNSVTKFVGDADTASGASGNMASVLQGLSGAVDTVGNTIKQHETAFSAIVNGLAGAAVAVGVAALAGSIGTVTTAVVALGVAMAANPAILALTLIAAAGAGIASLASDWKKSAEGMRAQMDGINADISLAEQRAANGSEPVKARAALELQTLKDKRDALRQTMALQDQSSSENASYNAKEMKNLQARIAAEQSAYAGSKPLDEVRKMAKLRNDILVEANDQAVNIAKGFNKAIASAASPADAMALTNERDQRLIANARETTAALKGFDDQKAAPAKAAAKQRLDAVIQYYESEQIAMTAGEQRAAKSLAARHSAGLETDQSYYLAKRAMAEADNAAQQTIVQAEIAAVAKSGLSKQDQTAQLDKFNQDLKRLREASKGIEEDFVNEMTALDMKLFRQGLEQNAQAIEAEQARAASLEEQVLAQRRANEEIGLSAQEVNALRAARMLLNAAEKEGLATSIELASPEMAKALRDRAAALRELVIENTKGVEKTAAVDSFKSLWDSVDQTARGVWTNIYQGGQDAFTKLRDTLKSTVWDLLYQMTVRKWIFNILAVVTGANVGSVAQSVTGASSGLGGLGNLGSIGASMMNFGGTIATGFMNTLAGGGLTSTFEAAGAMMANGFTAQGLGMAAGGLGVIGLGIGALSLLKSAMDYKITPTGNSIVANVGSSGASAVANRADFRQEGGLFGGGTTNNSSWSQADKETTRYIDDSVKSVTAANRAYAQALGLNASALDGYTAQLDINVSGMDAAAAKAAIDAQVVKFAGEQASAAYGDALSAFSNDGESASATLARLGTELTHVNGWAGLFGATLYDVSLKGAAGADVLVKAFGGLEKFNASMATYYSTFYTKEEQRQKRLETVQVDLKSMGIDIGIDQLKNASKEQIRAWVELEYQMNRGAHTAEEWARILTDANNIGSDAPTGDTQTKDPAKDLPWWMDFAPVQGQSGGIASPSVGGGGAGGGDDLQTFLKDFKASIADWMKKYQDTAAGGLDIWRQRDNAWASFQTQLTLARGGDREAMGKITGTADTLIDAIKQTSGSAFEQRLAIAKVQASVVGLTDQVKPEQLVVNAVDRVNDTLRAGFEALTGQSLGGGTSATVIASMSPATGRTGSGAGMVPASGLASSGSQVAPAIPYLPPARTHSSGPANGEVSGGASGVDLAKALRAMADRLESIEANTESSAISEAGIFRVLQRVMPDADEDVIAVQIVVPKGSYIPVRNV